MSTPNRITPNPAAAQIVGLEPPQTTPAPAEPTPSVPYLQSPALSPDGSQLAFVYASDIWLVSSAGGTAERLTAHPGTNIQPRFAPDGHALAFTSFRTGSGDVYILPLDGGDLRRLTFDDSTCYVCDWAADGQAIYFESAYEQQGFAIWYVSLDGRTPVCLYAEPYESLSQAAISPDGAWLALTVERQRWWRRGPDPYSPEDILLLPALPPATASADTLPRLVIGADAPFAAYAGANRAPLWSPDGQGLYFVSDRDGTENLWYYQLEPPALTQITHFRDGRLIAPSIARNAPVIAFERHAHGDDGVYRPQIWRLDLVSHTFTPLTIRVRPDTQFTPIYTEYRTRAFSEFALAPDGKKVAFVARGNVFADFADKETDRERREGDSFPITQNTARQSELVWHPRSRVLVYVSDRSGEPELYAYDFTTQQERQLTRDGTAKRAPCIAPDGTHVAYIRGADAIWLLNLDTGEQAAFARGVFIWSSDLAWSPDSQWLAFISLDEQFFSNVYVQQRGTYTARQITFLSNVEGSDLRWSPDGQYLVFSSGQFRAESQIVRVDLRPPSPQFREADFEKLFSDAPEPTRKSVSPSTGQTHPDPAAAPADAPDTAETPDTADTAETPDTADTAETPDTPTPTTGKPVEIVFEGIQRRLHILTPPQMDASVAALSPDSRDLLFLANVAGKTNIWNLHMDEARRDTPPRQLIASSSSKAQVQFAPDGKSFYYLDDGQITIRKFPAGNDATVLRVRSSMQVDFAAEKEQVFGEVWRLMRDYFYDESFGGRDWHALRQQFAPLVHAARVPADLLTAINLMIGELGTSHTGVYWSGKWESDDGYTGLVFDPQEQLSTGALRVADVVPDSPVAHTAQPPQPGEYLVAVNGTPITPQACLPALLHERVGQRVRLAFAPMALPAEPAQIRTLDIRLIDSEEYEHLRYRAWVDRNRAYTERISKGRLGYVHIPEMTYTAYQQFLLDLDAATHACEGVVLDMRYNGGGYIATFILDVLTRRKVLRTGFRGALATDPYHLSGNRTLDRPTVLVTNEQSASNTEIFTEMYRRLGLGQVVGKPTAGRVIGTVNRPLLNGSYVRLPMYAYTTPEGENLEGTGRQVDVRVAQPVGAWQAGHDAQLDAAVATLLATLDGI